MEKGYNASQVSSQKELNCKFKKILKILENNVANFDEYCKKYIYPKTTLLRKYIILISWLKVGYNDFTDYYDTYVEPEMSLCDKFDKVYEFLVDFYGED